MVTTTIEYLKKEIELVKNKAFLSLRSVGLLIASCQFSKKMDSPILPWESNLSKIWLMLSYYFLPAYKSTLPQDLSIILAYFKISTCDYELKKKLSNGTWITLFILIENKN